MPRKPPRQRKPPVSLSDEQFLALLQKAKEHRLRDWVLILFTYCHGFRASEPLAVTAADFDLKDGKVFVRRGKGSEGGWQDLMSWPDNPLLDERSAIEYWLANREKFGVKGGAKPGIVKKVAARKMQQSTKIVTFSPDGESSDERNDSDREAGKVGGHAGHPGEAYFGVEGRLGADTRGKPAGGPKPLPGSSGAHLAPLPPRHTPSERLFPISRTQFWRLVHQYALAAGIPKRKCKTHMLKHTIAKHLVRAGHPLNEIQEWMGWRSIETMNWYTRPDEEELGQRIGDTLRHKQGLRPVRQGNLF